MPKPVGRMMCFLLMTFVPVQKLCVNNQYIYMHSLDESCYRTYICTQQECRSVLVKLHPITVYRTVLGEYAFLGRMPFFVFFGLSVVSCSMINSLILAISHLTGYFCPWTFFQNIEFNMVPSDPLMAQGEFQALQLIVLVTFGVVD